MPTTFTTDIKKIHCKECSTTLKPFQDEFCSFACLNTYRLEHIIRH